MTEFAQKPPVVLEVDTEQYRNGEDILTMRDRVENTLTETISKLDHFLGVTGGTKPSPFATEGQKVFMGAIRTTDSGKPLFQVPAVQVLVHNLTNYRAKEAVLSFESFYIGLLKSLVVIRQHLPERRDLGIPGMIAILPWIVSPGSDLPATPDAACLRAPHRQAQAGRMGVYSNDERLTRFPERAQIRFQKGLSKKMGFQADGFCSEETYRKKWCRTPGKYLTPFFLDVVLHLAGLEGVLHEHHVGDHAHAAGDRCDG